MIPLIYPIGAGALALIALRLRATSKPAVQGFAKKQFLRNI